MNPVMLSSVGRRIRHLRVLEPSSRLHFLLWRSATRRWRDVTLRLRTGLDLELRHNSTDHYGLSEIFFNNQYRPPAPVSLPPDLRTIVDVGANVGYSCLYFARQFPRAAITAFEPHPGHVSQIGRHLARNRLADRVTLVAAAAGVAEGQAYLTDREAGSRLIPGSEQDMGEAHGNIAVPVVDWFASLPQGNIDLLKIDVEGSEYVLLSDTRFLSDVAPRTSCMVLEWHNTSEVPDGKSWCEEHLRAMGYRVFDGASYGHAGLIWCVH